ncbi:MAG: hypothetical protein OWT28_05305 [Firmicutes bacterium]|nr:hypothetical protein [Bacillota bacterium]
MDEQAVLAWFATRADRQRLGHAYILEHPVRERSEAVAQNLCQSLLCTARAVDGTPCGVCDACVQVRSGNHPGLIWVEPDGASLKIAQMRAALRLDRHQTGREGMHIIVLSDAGRLTPEAGNAILKWVEEPGEARLFLLLTRAQSAILSTLRSRCQVVRLRSEQEGLEARWETLRTQLGDERFAQAQKLMVELTVAWAARDRTAWQSVSTELGRIKLTGDEALYFVDAWMTLFREIVAVRASADQSRLRELAPGLHALDARADAGWLAQCVLALADQRRRLQSHVSPVTAFEALLIRSLSPVG